MGNCSPGLEKMTLQEVLPRLMLYLLVIVGLLGGFVYARLALDDIKKHKAVRQVLNWASMLSCFYVSVLWGGQELRIWVISPAFGRPALLLAISALTWKGILSWNSRGRR